MFSVELELIIAQMVVMYINLLCHNLDLMVVIVLQQGLLLVVCLVVVLLLQYLKKILGVGQFLLVQCWELEQQMQRAIELGP